MVAGRPYYHAYPADFFMATQGWDHETKGVYRLVIDLLNERDRPIPDDPKFVAGVVGCSVQRWKKIREFLFYHGKLMLTEDGHHLTNPRFEREHASRAEQRDLARMNGHAGHLAKMAKAGQTDLDFTPEKQAPVRGRARTERGKSSKKVGKNIELSSNKVPSDLEDFETTPAKNNDLAQDPLQLRTRANSSESIEEDSTQPTITETRATGRLENAELFILYEACIEAAGMHLVSPEAINRAMAQVENWRDQGISFDDVIIPSIRATVLASDEPSRTLARFNAKVAHEHAKAKAARAKKTEYVPPQIPKLNPDDEDPQFLSLRTDLLETLGAQPYCFAFNPITFEAVEHGDKRPLRLKGPDHSTEPIRHGRWRSVLLAAARPYGFTDIW